MLLFLYGPPASGKSTLGRPLAAALDLPFLDLDQVIVQQAGRSIPEIFQTEGEAGFRAREARALEGVIQAYRGSRGAVVALGGGALLRPENRQRAEAAGKVLLLEAPLPVLLQRMQAAPHQRPLVPQAQAEALTRLLRERAAHYQSFPRRLNTAGLALRDLVWQAQIRLGWFRLRAMGPAYDVLVHPGLLRRGLGEALQARLPQRSAWALVSDTQVFGLHGAGVQAHLQGLGPTHVFVVEAGEASKRLPVLESLWQGFLQKGLDRHSGVVALGGGVVGDLAGFAAATFMRGVPWVNLPTSLLAMVDAAIGGKTGIDLAEAKNAVGAFHPPQAVLADPDVLRTLPQEEWRHGLAEVVKHALLGDPDLWAMLEQGLALEPEQAEALVSRAMAVKVRVVEADPWERRGLRSALNAGHTVGHAIEAALGYRIPHGQAVAIGLVVEAALAEALHLAPSGWHQAVAAVLRRYGLPTRIPQGVPWDHFITALRQDKKRRQGTVRFALPVAVGKVETGVPVPEAVLQQVFRAFQQAESGPHPAPS